MIALTPMRTPGTLVYHLSAAGRVPLCGDTVTKDHLTGWPARGDERPGDKVTLCTRCQVRADLLTADGEELTEADESRVRDRAKVQAFRRAAVLGLIVQEMNRTDENLDWPTFEDYLFDVARYLGTVVEDV